MSSRALLSGGSTQVRCAGPLERGQCFESVIRLEAGLLRNCLWMGASRPGTS